jgi:ankyrin repeat protein
MDYTAGGGHMNIVKYLKNRGFNYQTGINIAAGNGHIEMIKYLESKGAKCDGDGVLRTFMNGRRDVMVYLNLQFTIK